MFMIFTVFANAIWESYSAAGLVYNFNLPNCLMLAEGVGKDSKTEQKKNKTVVVLRVSE